MTGDRSSFIGRNGTLSDPLAMEFAHLPGRVGALLDPCGAVQTTVTVGPGESVEVTFLLGEGTDEEAARALVAAYNVARRSRGGAAGRDRPVERAAGCSRGRHP